MTAAPETRIALVREQISALTDQGLDSIDIAARLGITVSRVDQILDHLEEAHLAAVSADAMAAYEEAHADDADRVYYRDRDRARQQASAATPSQPAGPKPRMQVRWLIPRGLDHTDMRAEYAIEKSGGGMQIVGFATAELHAADGTKILTRWTTNWVNAR